MLGPFRLVLLSSTLISLASAYSGIISTLELRLQTPLTSYKTAPETIFQSVLIAPCMIGDRVLLPSGTIVYGSVKHRTPVGVGIVHERAGLDLDFYQYQLPDGRRFSMTGKLQLIENARETVNDRGHVQGVLAANNPQHWFDGLWNHPSMTLFQHSLLGLTGMSGRVFNFFEMGPIGGACVIAFRIAVFNLPEPEIRLPSGTEMKVSITSLPEGAPRFPTLQESLVPDDLSAWVREQPFTISMPNGRMSEDIVNLAFIGTRDQIANAFEAAGWKEATPRSVRAFSHVWNSYASKSGYADAPASRLRYLGAEPELIYEKSFNTVTMRHHVRLWRSDSVGREVCLAAATHDVAIRFGEGIGGITHKIDPRIDFERTKIQNDLAFADCAEPAGYVERPQAVRKNEDIHTVQTDGRLAVIALHNCSADGGVPDPSLSKPARSIFVRSTRRVVLETRQYLFRANPYYWAYCIWKWNDARTHEQAFIDY